MNSGKTRKTVNQDAAVARIDIVERWDYQKRFKVTISTPTPSILMKKLKEQVPSEFMDSLKPTLPELLDAFFDLCKTKTVETDSWLLYEVKETTPPRDDRIFRAINAVRKEDGKQPLKWSHLALYVACKTNAPKACEVEQQIRDWIMDDLLDGSVTGELQPWVVVTPVKLLPNERVKRGKPIKIPQSVIEDIIEKARKDSCNPRSSS
jgi:hypothetical protein